MKPLPTWEEIASRVAVEGGMVRVVELRYAFGASAAKRLTGGASGGTVSAAEVRDYCHRAATTETLGAAARRVGLKASELRHRLRKLGVVSVHDGRKGATWHRIPLGIADRIAADRRGAP